MAMVVKSSNKTILGHTRPNKAIQGHTRPYKAIQGNTRQQKATKGNKRKPSRDYTRPKSPVMEQKVINGQNFLTRLYRFGTWHSILNKERPFDFGVH